MMKMEKLRNSNFRYRTCTIGLFIAFSIFVVHLFSSYGPIGPQYQVIRREQRPHQSENVPKSEPKQSDSEGGMDDGILDYRYVEENLYSLNQKDLQLIQYTRIRHLTPPSKLPYNLKGKGNYKDEFSAWVADFFGNKTNGIFIEAGAHEGESASHTLYLERELGWTGLLVECNPTVIPYLKSHHRRAWVASACLAPTTTPGVLNFSNPTNWTFSGTFKKPWNLPVPTKWTSFEVDTVPFYTILAALGWKEVDYFSFDIEGSELGVLKTLPFDQIIFKVLIIEVMFYKEEEKKELDLLLKSNGYHFVRKMQVDRIYVHDSVKHLIRH